MFNMFAGGGINRMAIFALNIMPYISASIIIQLAHDGVAEARSAEERRRGRPQDAAINTRVTSRCFWPRSRPMASPSACRAPAMSSAEPGLVLPASRPSITLTGGTMFLMWLGEQITARGIGNGISLIILAGIVAELPSAIAGMLELGRQGALSTGADPGRHRDGGRRDRLHRVHRARAAPAADPVSEAPGRQQDVRGPVLASAAEAEHGGRDSADLRVVAAAAADDDRQLQCRQGAGMVSVARSRSSATAVRCSWFCICR